MVSCFWQVYDIVPLGSVLLVLFVLCIVIGVGVVSHRYRVRDTQLCLAFKSMDKLTREDYPDLVGVYQSIPAQ